MGLKLLTRISMLAGLQDRGTLEKPDVTLEMPGSITNFSCEMLQPFGVYNFSAQHYYNEAIERGLYFSNRMPDWATEFKKQTTDILNTKRHSSLSRKRFQDHQCTERSFLYPKLRSENSPLDYFNERKCSAQGTRPNEVAIHQPVKPPKIKDDITCRKRQSD